ncbi:MAG: CDP-alcohol phosphatidyltransferase family protein [Candidatus Heimdallarchaeota archaeon]|nr:MAG: CDP-alcohol phosphatidyltransferase family protein [Candidatus Heimdallarchaeota archaeon]
METSKPPKKLRKRYESFFAPFGRFLAKTGITPNMISIMSVSASILSCAAYASGPTIGSSLGLLIGTLLLGCSSLLDMLDGSLARAKGIAGHFGALLDRTLDRVSEFFFLLGILIGGYVYPEWVFFCFEGMILASYIRSTAEKRGGLSMDSTTGIFERKEKITVLSIGCLAEILIIENFIGIGEWWFFHFGILGLIVLIIGIMSNISAFQRLMYARKFYSSSENKNS